MKKVYFKTFGCRTNIYDSQSMMKSLTNYKIIEDEKLADIIVINSCTVTNGADANIRSYINYIEKINNAKLYLTGCGAHTKGKQLLEDKKVYGVFGQSEKSKIDLLFSEQENFLKLGDLNYVDNSIVDNFIGKSRAFIKIQEGCNFKCSYCIIPFVRGDARSMNEELILKQIANLALNGFGEFVLTGTNIGSYGQDKNTSLVKLLKKISKIRGVRRIRLGSIEPIQLDDEFKEILDEDWLEKHLHIALQHTSPQMLRLMNRRNVYKKDRELFETLEEKGFAIGTDFITGHPGESEDIWREAIANFKSLPITHIHSFTYSKRDGTKSASMKNIINGAVAKKRLHEINTLVQKKNLEFRKKQTTNLDILIENEKDGNYYGLDQYFNKIIVKSNQDLIGNWINLSNYKREEDINYANF